MIRLMAEYRIKEGSLDIVQTAIKKSVAQPFSLLIESLCTIGRIYGQPR